MRTDISIKVQDIYCLPAPGGREVQLDSVPECQTNYKMCLMARREKCGPAWPGVGVMGCSSYNP